MMSESPEMRRWTRRSWLKRAAQGCMAAGVGIVVNTFWIEPFWLEIVQRDLPVAGLPARWHGRLLAQVSDVHVGDQVSDRFLERAFDRLREYSPHLVVVTGDFMTLNRHGTAPLAQVQQVFQKLPLGSLATVGILGNHDYGVAWSQFDVADLLGQRLEGLGLRLLRNEAVDVDGLEIVGIDDLWAGRCDLSPMQIGRETNPRIVLCHNPDAVDLAGWGNYRGWILSGHTHGGQCKPPFLPPPLLPVRNRRYTAGPFDLWDGRWLYVNRGLGHLLRVRFNARPEITLFRLVNAGSTSSSA